MRYKQVMKPIRRHANAVHNDHTPRIIAIVLLTVLLVCGLARARVQAADKPAASPAGVYQLVSVDGKNVPCTINHSGTTMNVQSGTFTITTNGQVTSVMTVSVGNRKDIRVERHATCMVKDAELTMKWQNAGTTKGRVTGRTFAITNEGVVYVYTR